MGRGGGGLVFQKIKIPPYSLLAGPEVILRIRVTIKRRPIKLSQILKNKGARKNYNN